MKKIKKVKSLLLLVMMCIITCACPIVTLATEPTTENTGGGYTSDALGFSMDENGGFTVTTNGQKKTMTQTFETLFTKFRTFCAGATGITILVIMLVLIIGFAKLAIDADNPNARSTISRGLIIKVLAAAGAVAVPMLIGLAANLFV